MKHPTPLWIDRLRLLQIELWAERLACSGRSFAPLFAGLLRGKGPALADIGGAAGLREDPAVHNLALVTSALALTDLDAEVLHFTQIMSTSLDFLAAVTRSAAEERHGLAAVLASALERGEEEVRIALEAGGALHRTGLMHLVGSNRGPGAWFWSALTLSHRLTERASSLESLVQRLVYPEEQPPWVWTKNCADEAARLVPRLQAFAPGTHVLVVGDPRHSRDLCAALACGLEAQLLGFSGTSHPGFFAVGHAVRYRLAQALFGGRGRYVIVARSAPCLLHAESFRPLPGMTDPPWQHLDLEQTKAPTLWLVPSLEVVDPRVRRLMGEVVAFSTLRPSSLAAGPC